MIVRTIALTAAPAYKQIIPPDITVHAGRWQWTVLFPAAVTLAEDSAGTNAQVGLAFGTAPVSIVAENEALWAAGTGNVSVLGCHYPN